MNDMAFAAGEAGAALRLGAAMRERAMASAAVEAARAELERAEARLSGADEEVESLRGSVSFDELLELVASLSARVAELEKLAASPPGFSRPVEAVSAPFGEDGGEAALPQGRTEALPGAPGAPPAAAAAPALEPPAAAESDPDGEELIDGRRPPNRSLLYMEGYERGFTEAEEGKPDSLTTSRGWNAKGHRAGRADAIGGLAFNPLEAFYQEMRTFAPREPLTPVQKKEATRVAAQISADRKVAAGRPAVAPATPVEPPTAAAAPTAGGGEVDPWDAADPSRTEGGAEGDGMVAGDGDDEEVSVPGFLRRD